jgi:hypothetical protein
VSSAVANDIGAVVGGWLADGVDPPGRYSVPVAEDRGHPLRVVDERVAVVLVVGVDHVVARPLAGVGRVGERPGDEGRQLAVVARARAVAGAVVELEVA